MKDRLVTLACALGALALFIVLVVQPEHGVDPRRDVSRPTTEEALGDGYYAAYTWLQKSGLRTLSLREPFNALYTRRDLEPQGNVLLVTLPATESFKSSETRGLQPWVHAGNTLLVIAALADDPQWSTAMGGVNVGDLKVLSGLDFNSLPARTRRAAALTVVPNRPHAYFESVDQAVATAPPAQGDWIARVPYASFMLALAHGRESGGALLWTRLDGAGRIVVVGAGSLFTDRALALDGNARLFGNIIAANLGPDGAVVFDDFHQGLAVGYDPEKFYRDPRLFATGAILLALWFVWVLGATRLRVPVARAAAPRQTDLVHAGGAFLARVLSRDVAARRLFEYFFRRVSLRTSSASMAAPWDYLQASRRISAPELAQLRHWHSQAYAGKRVPLVRLYNLILRIDRQIT